MPKNGRIRAQVISYSGESLMTKCPPPRWLVYTVIEVYLYTTLASENKVYDKIYWLLASTMEQNYVAVGSFKNRILVGIKLSRYLVVHDLALIKDLLPRV